MKSRVRFFVVSSQANLATLQSAFATDFAAAPKWAVDRPVTSGAVSPYSDSALGVAGEARFLTAADAQTFYNLIVSRWTSGPNATRILAGSFVEFHSCSHDDGRPGPCVISQRTVK